MTANYRAWEIDVGAFPRQGTDYDKLKFLLRFAVLAPSGHNTQPWNFSIKGNRISLWVNRDRSLEGSDPHRRQLMIAFGCAIENLLIAANHYGYESSVRYFPNVHDRDWVTEISVVEGKENRRGNDDDFIAAIPSRHTNRSKYLNRPVPKSFWGRIKRYETSDSKISMVTEQDRRRIIADIVNEAQIEAMDDVGFREELSHYIKSSFTRQHAGMPGFALEIPAPISLFTSQLIKHANLSRVNKKKDDALLKRYTPGGFVVISTRKNNSESWLAAGRLFERIWLASTAEGLNCSPMAAVIQSVRHNQQLRAALDLDFEPQVFFRIGYADKRFRHSPRFSVDQLLINK